ncbi:uncharacterized protein EAE97_007873 [Botrytis byssoidea]|uniref:DUF6590 domain-containing protein n=1 Tax=Botrytis byssoidea TaxID=139641 RepID=A0A9P5IBC4_9HELO|nr:uncharacterized protein EAE97_007873 [Botrytis byssoidea]KAF7936507.1 hypothetical protein EAE97_007873 [Botrytis byssoidea]
MAMSSSTSHKHSRTPREPSGPLWSNWEWDSERERWQSYRTNSRGKTEWKFKNVFPSSTSAVAHIPRLEGASSLDTVSEDTAQYSNDQNYTTSNNNIGAVTESLAATSLDPRPNPDPPIVAKLQRNNTSTQYNNFDPNYKVHSAREFKFGKVFKVLWSEPSGSTAGGGGGTVWSQREVHGEMIYAKVRRFVIIHPKQGHCLCLPIMSYEGRATSKSGVHPEEHAIIYTTPEPRLIDNEDGNKMKFDPVKMIPYSRRHILDTASRINYAKIYTVEYNVKVWFIGQVDQACEHTVKKSYNDANQPLPLSSQPSVPTAYSMNNPTYDNSSYAMPGPSSNLAGYPSTASYSSTLGYGNQMFTPTPGYGAASANSNIYGSSQYSAPNCAQPLYSQPQYPPQYASPYPPQYPPPQYPPSQYPPSQHQPYSSSTSQGYNYESRNTHEPGSGDGQQ